MALQTRYLTAPDGLQLAYDERGEGPPVVFVHGAGLNRRRWRAQVRALEQARFRAVRFDLRGFGDSQMPDGPYDMPTLVADLRAVIDGLELGSVHLVGHSLGGMICQRYALDHPDAVRSLTLASTSSHQGRRSGLLSDVMVLICERGFDAFMADDDVRSRAEATLAEVFPDGAPPLEYFRTRELEEPNLAQAHAWRTTAGFTVKDELHGLRAPVLVLHGATDPLIPLKVGEWLHEGVKGSRFVVLPGGHSIQVECSEDFNTALIEHLRSAEAAATPS